MFHAATTREVEAVVYGTTEERLPRPTEQTRRYVLLLLGRWYTSSSWRVPDDRSRGESGVFVVHTESAGWRFLEVAGRDVGYSAHVLRFVRFVLDELV